MNGFINKPAAVTILACDTTQSACSACVHLPCGTYFETYKEIGRGHAECLPVQLRDVLAEAEIELADLDRLAVTIGPGTFAGVRVGVAAVRALNLLCAVPVHGITTFKALAASLVLHGEHNEATSPPFIIGVVIDARSEEFYTQIFAPDLTPLTAPQIQNAEQFMDTCNEQMQMCALPSPPQIKLVGSGAPFFAPRLSPHLAQAEIGDAPHAPRAKIIAQLAAREPIPSDTSPPAPLYLRPPDARPTSQAPLRMA